MSIPLQNCDWPTIGTTQSAEVRVYPVGSYGNKAPNPGFETPMPEITTSADWTSQGWTCTCISAGHREVIRTVEDGYDCLKFTNDNSLAGTNPVLRMTQWLHDCSQGDTWRATVWLKGTGQFTFGMIYQYNTMPPYIGQMDAARRYNIALTGTWTQVSVDLVVPTNVERVAVDMGSEAEAGGTTAYVRGITFSRVPAAGAIQVALSRDGGVLIKGCMP